MHYFYRFSWYGTRLLLHLVWGLEIVFPERLNLTESVIVAANHLSNYDPPVVGAVLPFEICFLAKSELFKNKLFGALIRKYNAIPIVRHTSDWKGINQVLNILETGKSLLLFPEGTRKGKIIKPGVGMFAMKAQKNILPIWVENTDCLGKCLFRKRRLRVVIGELIKYESFQNWEQCKENYQKIADYTFQKIGELKDASSTR